MSIRPLAPLVLFSVTLLIMPLRAWSDHRTRCNLVCSDTYIVEAPRDPDDVFRLLWIKVPLEIASGATGLVQDALRGPCTLEDCVPVVHDTSQAFSGIDIDFDCNPTSFDSDSLNATVAIRLCASTAAREGRPDLVTEILSCFPRLLIRVHNRGSSRAELTTTRVEVQATVPIPRDLSTPVVAPGGFVEIDSGRLPTFCLRGCSVTASADFFGQVEESDESNNRASQICHP